MLLSSKSFLEGKKIGADFKSFLYIAHIGALAFAVFALWLLFGMLGGVEGPSKDVPSFYDPNENVSSWSAYQRNAEYGAYAGALEGLSN